MTDPSTQLLDLKREIERKIEEYETLLFAQQTPEQTTTIVRARRLQLTAVQEYLSGSIKELP